MCNIHEIAEQSDHAIGTNNEKLISELIEKAERWTSNDHTNEDRCYAHYVLANLYSKLAFNLKENASGWRDDNYPKNLIAEINHLRFAKKLVSHNFKTDLESRIQTNLANALAHQRRNMEVLNEWKIDFSNKGDAPFVSSLSKARELIWISKSLNDESHQHLYQYEAYLLLKKLSDNISKADYQKISDKLKTDPELSNYLANGAEFFAPLYQNIKNTLWLLFCEKEKHV
ncbi:MAG: hypothetical protein COV35_07570 [Alphaproteobacteria bacterium CG11_big_fil_rev_8_21_14_0_20_39_49]|nr:MAG: hypothetical protein COV35_07570 [Alphaproteobacteria bacterium CG11_big_fil_rev_8_21_14_0_20_39_49]